MKLDAQGAVEWAVALGDAGYRQAFHSVAVLPDGYLAAGYFNEDVVVVARFSIDGDLLWQRSYRMYIWGHWYGSILEPSTDGAFYLGFSLLDSGARTVPSVLNLSPDGDVLWHRGFEYAVIDWIPPPVPLVATSGGGVVAVHARYDADGGWIPRIVALDADGAPLWRPISLNGATSSTWRISSRCPMARSSCPDWSWWPDGTRAGSAG